MPDELPSSATDWQTIDRQHIWHPYSAIGADTPVYPVVSAAGVRLRLRDGRELIDGMASWWCAIHGYNHPVLNAALHHQTAAMAHVMFGGLTHEPAAQLTQLLVNITPTPLESVFFTDSGSVAVEAAMKMAVQYWQARGCRQKRRFLAPCRGYHGDTLHAMSVCDPVTGMHHLFADVVPSQMFVAAPEPRFGEPCTAEHLAELEGVLATQADHLAAVILEPIVQGAGGMRFYAADYLARVRALCDQYQVLLIADEIATGFGRTGRLFACEHAAIAPDVMCVGKALTGGYMTLAAVLSTTEVSTTIAAGEPGVFMHGPTFTANPLACAVAAASIELLLASDWQATIQRIAGGLERGLAPCADLPGVVDVRVLGAIGVVELNKPVDMAIIQPLFVAQGVWVRPFGRLVYVMPPFVMSDADLMTLCAAIVTVIQHYSDC
ncbi:MAG: adenosylmethionine--8-amino-7-oxononanoate transaminase [Pseudomonadota bacterium]